MKPRFPGLINLIYRFQVVLDLPKSVFLLPSEIEKVFKNNPNKLCDINNICCKTKILVFSRGNVSALQCKPGMGDLFTITGRMNCALSLAGRKIN